MQIDVTGKVHSILQTRKIYFCDFHGNGDSTARPPEINNECSNALQHGYYVYENTDRDVCVLYHTRCLCVRTFIKVFNETALQHLTKWLHLLQKTFPDATLVWSPQGRPYINLKVKNVVEDVSFFDYPLPTPHITYQIETI
jgi:hypothetical protein